MEDMEHISRENHYFLFIKACSFIILKKVFTI